MSLGQVVAVVQRNPVKDFIHLCGNRFESSWDPEHVVAPWTGNAIARGRGLSARLFRKGYFHCGPSVNIPALRPFACRFHPDAGE